VGKYLMMKTTSPLFSTLPAVKIKQLHIVHKYNIYI
jgi:hypothetical protein